MSLNVAILTWEYPPRIVGEIAHYTERLALELSRRRINISVITFHNSPYLRETISENLEIYRVPNPVDPHTTIVTWSLSLCAEIQRIVANIFYDSPRRPDLIDAHEWQFVVAAIDLKKALHLPFVLTLHSLEVHRTSDTSAPLSRCIRGLERMGIDECSAVITKSNWMKAEVQRVHGTHADKVRSVPSTLPSLIDETLHLYQDVRLGV